MRIVCYLKGEGLSKASRLRRGLSCVRGGLGGRARGRAIIFHHHYQGSLRLPTARGGKG